MNDLSAVWGQADDVARLARRICRHREDAEDVSQASLVKAAEHIRGFRGEASVRTWLHRITVNECRMLRRRLTPGSLDAVLERGDLRLHPLPPAEGDTTPEDLAAGRALRVEVLSAIAGLPERQRTALTLRQGAGLSVGEVAARLGTTVPGVRSLLVRARQGVRDRLAA